VGIPKDTTQGKYTMQRPIILAYVLSWPTVALTLMYKKIKINKR